MDRGIEERWPRIIAGGQMSPTETYISTKFVLLYTFLSLESTGQIRLY